MKEYLKIFNLLLLSLFLSTPLFAKNGNGQELYPDFNITKDANSLRLIFIKDDKSVSKLFSINGNNKKEYIKNINDDEMVSVFQGNGITEGKSVYLITRSKVKNGSRNGYYYNITELPIIDTENDISVKFFQGDSSPTEFINCFDGSINKDVVTCKYKTVSDIKNYIAKLHSHKECQQATYKDENTSQEHTQDINSQNKQSNNEQCNQLDLDKDFYLSGYVCFYSNQSLLETYKNYRKENIDNENGKNLRREIIPLKNYNDVIIKGSQEVSYKWSGNKKLAIELFFAGGITKLNFEEKENGTELLIIYDAD